jgi:hypothetical protein
MNLAHNKRWIVGVTILLLSIILAIKPEVTLKIPKIGFVLYAIVSGGIMPPVSADYS